MNSSNNLLQRIPELRVLLDEPSCRRAIQSGSAFRVYRALLFARFFKRCPQHQDLLNTLLTQRRLFANTRSHTGQYSAQVWGSRLFGCQWQDESASAAQHDVDGSFLAGLVFFVAGIPLFSLGSYLVKPNTQSGAKQNPLTIMAPVPEQFSRWLNSRLLLAVFMLLIGSGSWLFYQQSHTQEILVINAFSDALEVEIDGQKRRIPAHASSQLTIRIGLVKGVAQSSALNNKPAFVVDRLQQKIKHRAGPSVWNIAGAAALLISSDTTTDAAVACGQRFVELNTPHKASDAPLRYLPPNISSPGNDDTDGGASPQLSTCRIYAIEHQQEALLSDALLAQAVLLDWDLPATQAAIAAAKTSGDAAAIEVAKRAADAKPTQLAYQVLLQDTRIDAGEQNLVAQELQQTIQQTSQQTTQQTTQQNSPISHFLAAQLQTGAEGIVAMQAAYQRFPQEPAILQNLVWRKAVHGHYAEAYQDLQRLHQLSPGAAEPLFDLEVQLLLVQGRNLDAIKLLQTTIRDTRAERRADHAADFALVARQSRIDPEFWLKELPAAKNDLSLLDFYRVRAGLKPYQNPFLHTPSVKLALALRSNPTQALSIAQTLNPLQLAQLSKAQLSLLLAEANRQNQDNLSAQTRALLHLNKANTLLLQQYVRGDNVEIDTADFDLEVQSAAFLVRSRNVQIGAQERNQLRNRAAQTDILRSVISTALAQW